MLVSPCQVKNKTFLLTKGLFGSYLLAHCSSLTAKSLIVQRLSLLFSYRSWLFLSLTQYLCFWETNISERLH